MDGHISEEVGAGVAPEDLRHIELLGDEETTRTETAYMIAGIALLGAGLDFSEYTEEQFAAFRSRDIPKIMWAEHKRRVDIARESLGDVGASVRRSWFRHGGEKPRRFRGTFGHIVRYLTTLNSDHLPHDKTDITS